MTQTQIEAGAPALARSLIYGRLAAAFRYPSAEGLHPALFSGESFACAAEVLDAPADIGALLERVRDRLEAATPDEIEARYVELFGHTVRGACPPYETEYGETRGATHVPHDLSRLATFYGAFGLRASQQSHERVDHVASECEFMQFLAYKQAAAEEAGDDRLVEATEKAEHVFLSAHLGRWALAFYRRVADCDPGGVYEAIARLGVAFVKADCERVGADAGSDRLRLITRSETRDDVFDCGTPDECPGARGSARGGGVASES